MSDRDLAPRTHALGREERERLNMDFGVGSVGVDGAEGAVDIARTASAAAAATAKAP